MDETSLQTSPDPAPAPRPRWDEQLAKWVSDVLSPPVIAVAALILVVQMMERGADYWWTGYFMILTVIIPVIYIIWQVRKGRIIDFHVRVREQRIRPLLLTLTGGVTSLFSLWIGQASQLLLVLAGMGVAQVAFILLVTLKWKISGHGAAIGSLAVFLMGLYGAAAAPALLAIPLVAWARVRLSRHTPAQTFFGSVAGVGFSLVILAFIK